VTGEPGGVPVRPGPPLADMGGGIFAAIGALSALYDRERTGKGRKLDIAMQDACISLLSYHVCEYFCTGVVPKPLSHSGHAFSVPYGVYKTKKGFIAIGPSWPRIARAIGADWLVDDPRFKDWTGRDEHREELNSIIEEYLAKAEAEDWVELFEAEDIPAGLLKSIDEVAVDPQVLHQKMILSLSHALGGEVKLAGNPIKMEDLSEKDYTAPPTLDQHGHEILSGLLGYSEEKIKKLKQEEKENTEERLRHVARCGEIQAYKEVSNFFCSDGPQIEKEARKWYTRTNFSGYGSDVNIWLFVTCVAGPIVLRYAGNMPVKHFLTLMMQEWAKLVEEEIIIELR
jgi:crotonobetainyl-CoA:carnitine CoA-transferase CaiB-like acyl-CoA transferase